MDEARRAALPLSEEEEEGRRLLTKLLLPSTLVPPLNFAPVARGVYRSAFPHPRNFSFLATLGLRTVVYLCATPYPAASTAFFAREGVRVMHVPVGANREPFESIDPAKVRLVLDAVCDRRNRPVLVHCANGKHRTGCVVGCLRKAQGLAFSSILEEFRRFAVRCTLLDQQFIELFDARGVVFS